MAIQKEDGRFLGAAGFRPDARSLGEAGRVCRPEIRVAELRRDVPVLAQLFTQPTTPQHLAGITPAWTAENVRAFYKEHPNYRPFVAVNEEGRVIGTVTVEEGSRGIYEAKVHLLAVDEDSRRQGVATELLRAAHSFIFSPREEGGLGEESATAGVIVNVAGSDAPTKLLRQQGYMYFGGELPNRCDSWNVEHGRLERRNVQVMILFKHMYMNHHRIHRKADFPAGIVPHPPLPAA